MTDLEDLKKILNNGEDTIPDKAFWFSDEFHYSGNEYNALGTIIFRGVKYEFFYNHEWGIKTNTLEVFK